MMPRSFLITIVSLALAATLFGQREATRTQEETPRETPRAHVIVPLDKIIGLPVRNDTRENLGEINDLLADARTGEVHFAVLEVGGFLGIGEKARIVPFEHLRIVPDEEKAGAFHARSSLTEAQVKSAPSIEDGAIASADLERRTATVFPEHRSIHGTDMATATLVRLSQFDGVALTDSAGNKIGKFEEVVIAPDNRCIAFAVIDSNDEAGDRDVSLMWSSLQVRTDDQNNIVATTPVERARFAQAPAFDNDDWKRMSSSDYLNEVANYHSSQPFWRSSRASTPGRLPQDAGTGEHLLANADAILNIPVRNDSDNNLGELGDLLVDPRTGEIRFAVLEVGGFLGIAEKDRVVDWNDVSVKVDEDKDDKFLGRTTLTEAQVKSAPVLNEGTINTKEMEERVVSASGEKVRRDMAHGNQPYLARVSEMDGVVIADPTGHEIGEIERLILAPDNNCVAYVVVDTYEVAGDVEVALPFSSLRYEITDGGLSAKTTVPLARFASGPRFDADDSRRMTSRAWVNEISTYYGSEPFWTAQRHISRRPAHDTMTAAGHGHVMAPSAKLIGLEVCDVSRDKVAKLDDVLLDPRTGEVRYAVLGVHRADNMGEDARIVPWRHIHIVEGEKAAQKYQGHVTVTNTQLQTAPLDRKGALTNAEIQKLCEPTFGHEKTMSSTKDSGQADLARLSRIQGLQVTDASGKNIGTIQSLVFAPQSDCVAYAVMTTSSPSGSRQIGVPWSCLEVSRLDDERYSATTRVASEKLNTAPEYKTNDWNRMASTNYINELSTHYESEPYWKNDRFAAPRKSDLKYQ